MKPKNETVILVVDDDRDLLELVAQEMISADFKVLKASSGNQAYRIISEQHVDLVISDVRMPDGTGIELLEKVRRGSNIPLIILASGFADLTLKDACSKGANALLMKPFDRRILVRTVENLLRVLVADERRASFPIQVDFKFEVHREFTNEAFDARVLCLGPLGAFIESSALPNVNEEIEFKLMYPNGGLAVLSGKAQVRWVQNSGNEEFPTGFAVDFLDLPSDIFRNLFASNSFGRRTA